MIVQYDYQGIFYTSLKYACMHLLRWVYIMTQWLCKLIARSEIISILAVPHLPIEVMLYYIVNRRRSRSITIVLLLILQNTTFYNSIEGGILGSVPIPQSPSAYFGSKFEMIYQLGQQPTILCAIYTVCTYICR